MPTSISLLFATLNGWGHAGKLLRLKSSALVFF
nr:MAG TPA: hypothetical protein [Caudoviricetes sp.]